MEAWLALETGRVFSGRFIGAPLQTGGEVVFHTGMTGYQEILTDPSYAGQIVVFTAAHIGNYGIQRQDFESQRLHPAAIVVRDFCRRTFHRRSEGDLDQVLRQAGVPALADVDTRAVTTVIREEGTCRAWLGTGTPEDMVARARAIPTMSQVNWVKRVTALTARPHNRQPVQDDPCEVAVLDFGVKKSILDRLTDEGCRVRVHPAGTRAAALLDSGAEGVFLSNGPGDPAGLDPLVDTIRDLLDADMPLFGICLGHQLLARALGAETVKLPFGHHGANHPVQRLSDGKVEITSQNHNYAVPADSLDPATTRITHRSLNDRSVEGLRAVHRAAYSVQFHPEAAPGPSDSLYLFREFRQQMLARRDAAPSSRKLRKNAATG